ncbi:MAG: hypothetical protein VKI81_05180, partial [Synechococcaceae cyanobacterium]|nr:hypothetical protein [Synechococcaceae cyanobacterium]
DVLRRAGDLPMEQVVAIENALIEGERLPASTVEVAREAVHDWVRAVAGDLELTAGGKGATKELVAGASG